MDQLRPAAWGDYIGQEKLKDHLQIKINGAVSRGEMLPHTLLVGPPGCGKTTIAELIADQMCLDFDSYIMPIKPNILRMLVTSFEGIVLFDEIHRMSPKQQEELLPVLHEGYLQLDSGFRLETGALTIIAATTELDKVIAPLYDRFIIKPPFEEYSEREMAKIVRGMAQRSDIRLSKRTAKKLGRATGGIPRNAKALVSMAKDLNTNDYKLILDKCMLTVDGLSERHLEYLRVLKNCGGTAGVELIGANLQLPKSILLDIERLLVKRNMMQYSKQGRILLPAGYKVIK